GHRSPFGWRTELAGEEVVAGEEAGDHHPEPAPRPGRADCFEVDAELGAEDVLDDRPPFEQLTERRDLVPLGCGRRELGGEVVPLVGAGQRVFLAPPVRLERVEAFGVGVDVGSVSGRYGASAFGSPPAFHAAFAMSRPNW